MKIASLPYLPCRTCFHHYYYYSLPPFLSLFSRRSRNFSPTSLSQVRTLLTTNFFPFHTSIVINASDLTDFQGLAAFGSHLANPLVSSVSSIYHHSPPGHLARLARPLFLLFSRSLETRTTNFRFSSGAIHIDGAFSSSGGVRDSKSKATLCHLACVFCCARTGLVNQTIRFCRCLPTQIALAKASQPMT